jgi:hypothetical protein
MNADNSAEGGCLLPGAVPEIRNNRQNANTSVTETLTLAGSSVSTL